MGNRSAWCARRELVHRGQEPRTIRGEFLPLAASQRIDNCGKVCRAKLIDHRARNVLENLTALGSNGTPKSVEQNHDDALCVETIETMSGATWRSQDART